MSRRIHPRLALVAIALLLALAAAPMFAQEQTGALFGTVTDEQKGALPGVTVTLTGSTGPQVQVTDTQGKFRFLNLPPGSYDLRAELQGFSTVELPDLAIKLGGKASLEVTLNGAVKDVITVTGESPLLDERRIDQGTNVTTVELDKVPTARDPWSLLSQAPGVLVDRVNVGGSESGQQSNFIGVGSGSRDNTFAVDGVILTDMNAVGGSATYFDFGAFDEIQFTVSSADVTVQTSGVLINQVTKRGTNEWRGNGRYLDTDGSLQSEPKQENGNKIDSVKEYGADIGGPLLKDHLWIWGAYGVSKINILAQGAARPDQAGGLQPQAELPDRAEQLGGPSLLDQRQDQDRARRGPGHRSRGDPRPDDAAGHLQDRGQPPRLGEPGGHRPLVARHRQVHPGSPGGAGALRLRRRRRRRARLEL